MLAAVCASLCGPDIGIQSYSAAGEQGPIWWMRAAAQTSMRGVAHSGEQYSSTKQPSDVIKQIKEAYSNNKTAVSAPGVFGHIEEPRYQAWMANFAPQPGATPDIRPYQQPGAAPPAGANACVSASAAAPAAAAAAAGAAAAAAAAAGAAAATALPAVGADLAAAVEGAAAGRAAAAEPSLVTPDKVPRPAGYNVTPVGSPKGKYRVACAVDRRHATTSHATSCQTT